MTKRLQHIFALSERGARDLVKSTLWTVICNIALMLPIGVVMATVQLLLNSTVTGESPLSHFWLYTGLSAALLVLLYVLHYFQYAALYNATFLESANRRIGIAETLRRLPLSFFGKRDLSDLTATMISDCAQLDQMFSHHIPVVIASCISTTIIGIMLFIMNWRMALAILWVVPVALVLTVGTKKLQDKYGSRSILKKRAVTDHIQEGLETIRNIKADNLEESYLAELNEKTQIAEQGCIQAELVGGSFISTAQAFLKVGLATTVLVGITQVTSGKLDFLFFLGFLFAAARIYDPISQTLQNIAATFNAKLYIDRMRAIQEEPVQSGTEHFTPDGFDIVFSHVNFSYQGDEEGVLKDVSFLAKQGEVTALVGPSGGGKSTAAKLAARFWDAGAGKITLGGVDVSSVDPETLLKYYAIVFQDVVLFRDTIMENIRLGRRGASDEEVLAAAKAAHCDEFVQVLPGKYETMIGENGATLSGGERQRISIARALLKNSPIVLLDEATASLDVENESAVQKALSHLLQGKTVLIIAHRMRTVAGADKIVVLEEGRVAEQGTPDELMKNGKFFRRMVQLQQETTAWTLGNNV
ncbi:ABC transporter ATP-binding protein [Blautia liquoris]|uniref:ABC transporter ATP-binding protein n=1 Tax=Blautia liquoris TaxID=2779518 RepID=A0A7M2RFT1_9FIRM|nr:ABC transporter ATP-binding protein [Blautia liquoris]QOV18998.1 ABC transporter ATP-binding protein [Blautia liquoris]